MFYPGFDFVIYGSLNLTEGKLKGIRREPRQGFHILNRRSLDTISANSPGWAEDIQPGRFVILYSLLFTIYSLLFTLSNLPI